MPKEPSKTPDDPTPDVDADVSEQVEEAQEEPRVVEVDGHEYTLEPGFDDDFELLDALSEMQRTGEPSHTPGILRRLVGNEQTRVVINRLRDKETGRVSVDAGSDFVLKLLDALDPN